MAIVKLPLHSVQATGKLGALSYNLNGFVWSRKIKKKRRKTWFSIKQLAFQKRFKLIRNTKYRFLKKNFNTVGLKIAKIKNP